MPIHLLWGDDEAARTRVVDNLISTHTDPAWQSINLTRLDGNDANQAGQALEEARTPRSVAVIGWWCCSAAPSATNARRNWQSSWKPRWP